MHVHPGLKVYSQALGGKVSYFHGHYGLGTGIVLHPDDRRYAPIECKLGNRNIEGGAYYKPYG